MANIWDEDYPTPVGQEEGDYRPTYPTPEQMLGSIPGERGYVSELFEQIDRPHHALWGALMAATGKTPQPMSVWEGAKKGFSLEDRYNLMDVLGVPRQSSEMPWSQWIPSATAHFIGDAVFNPVNLLPMGAIGRAATQIPKVGKYLARLPESYAKSSIGKATMMDLPAGITLEGTNVTSDAVNALFDRLSREGSPRMIQEQAQKAQANLERAVRQAEKQLGRSITPEEITEAYERYGVRRPGGTVLDEWGEQVPDAFQGIYEAIRPMGALKGQAREQLRAAQQNIGAPLSKMIDEEAQNYLAHQAAYPGGWYGSLRNWLGGRRGDIQYDARKFDPSRDIYLFEDAKGNRVSLGSVDDPRTRVIEERVKAPDGKEVSRYFERLEGDELGQELFKRQASLAEKAKEYNWYDWNFDPIDALTKGTIKDKRQQKYYELLGELINMDALKPSSQRMINNPLAFQNQKPVTMRGVRDVDKASKEIPDLVREPNYGAVNPDLTLPGMGTVDNLLGRTGEFGVAPGSVAVEKMPGWRKLEAVPGFEGYYAPKALANVLENRFADVTSVGDMVRKSVPGQALQDLTRAWVNTTLPLHPKFHFANKLSDYGMQYAAGMSPLNMIQRNLEGRNIRLGRGQNEFAGMSNAELFNDLVDRGMMRQGFFQSAAEKGYGSNLRQMAEHLGGNETIPGKIAGKVADVGDKVKAAHEWGYKKGNEWEFDDRAAMAMDWLRKQHPEFAKYAPEQKATILDEASRFANKALVDYSKAPFERNLTQVYPFWSWHKGSSALAGERLLNAPKRMSRMNALMNNAFEPLSDQERAFYDEWVTQQNPVKAALGINWDTDRGPGVGLLGRGLFTNDLEQFTKNPLMFAMGRINPNLRAPVDLLTGFDSSKFRQIDPEPGVYGPKGVINPILDKILNPIRRGLGLDEQEYPYSLAGRKTLGTTLPASFDYASTIMPMGTYLNELRGPYNYLSNKIFDTPIDPNRSEQGSLGALALQYLTGNKVYPMDVGKRTSQLIGEFDRERNFLVRKLNDAGARGDDDAIEFYQKRLENLQLPAGLR